MGKELYAYIAGPLFNEGERWFNKQIEQIVSKAGIPTYLPQRDGGVLKSAADINAIFQTDLENLDQATLVVANLNGIGTDAGTAWELGYAHAQEKYLIGIHTDARGHSAITPLNPMIAKTLNVLVSNLSDLRVFVHRAL